MCHERCMEIIHGNEVNDMLDKGVSESILLLVTWFQTHKVNMA